MKKRIFYGLLILPMIFGLGLSGLDKQNSPDVEVVRQHRAAEEQSAVVDLKYLFDSQFTKDINSLSSDFVYTNYRGLDDNKTVPISESINFLTLGYNNDLDNKYPPFVRLHSGDSNYYFYLRNSSGDTAHFSNVTISAGENYRITGIDLVLKEDLPANAIYITGDGQNIAEGSNDLSYTFEGKSNLVLSNKIAGKYVAIKQFSIRYIPVNGVTLTFDTGVEGIEVKSQTLIAGETLTIEPTAPERPNEGNKKFTFGGWYLDNETYNVPFIFGNVLTEDTTVYAKWIEETITGYNVRFVLNNGTDEVIEQTIEVGQLVEEPAETPTKPSDDKYDYTFLCWCSDEALTTPFDLSTVINGDITLYAYYSYEIRSLEGEQKFDLKINAPTVTATVAEYTKDITFTSQQINSALVDSTFRFVSNSPENNTSGFSPKGTWDIYVRYADMIWNIIDYSKYIETVRFDIKNTEYNNYGLGELYLYKGMTTEGEKIDTVGRPYKDPNNNVTKDTVIQMVGNNDESVRSVVVSLTSGRGWGWANIRYILKDASVEQQCINFANDFLANITCSGYGSVTFEKAAWDAIAEKVAKYLTDADVLEALKGNVFESEVVRQAIERYDAIVSKYGESEYADFLDRFDSNLNTNFMKIHVFDESMNSTVLLTAVAILISICAVIIFVKRKHAKQ